VSFATERPLRTYVCYTSCCHRDARPLWELTGNGSRTFLKMFG
jgi:hypothetical protein